MDEVVNDTAAVDALLKLDIDEREHRYLSDILDPDNSGRISMKELLDGLRRLRGEPRRSDSVTIDLMTRRIQRDVSEILDRMKTTKKGLQICIQKLRHLEWGQHGVDE